MTTAADADAGNEEKKVHLLVELPKCPHATERPTPDLFTQFITVTVGTGAVKRTFYVFEALLKHYSSYFRTALNGHWPEGELKAVNLPEDCPDVFQAFFNWLFTQKLYNQLTPKREIPLSSEIICQAYIFGDARGIPEFCNASINLLFQQNMQMWEFTEAQLPYIYNNTVQDSLLRKYMVDYAGAKLSLQYPNKVRQISQGLFARCCGAARCGKKQAGLAE